MLHQNKSFRIFTFSVFIIILIPAMMQQGMFLDGITYSAISQNLADGIGTFWNPHYTNTLYPVFYEHPPLVFGIQSIFFKVFGNSFLTENIYSLFTCFLASMAIILIWNQPFKNSTQKNWSWIPLLLWIITPIIGFSFKNNLLENTLSVFTLFAVYFQIVSIQKNNYFYLVLGSLAVVSGFLSKGFVALFPLITISIYIIVFKEFKNRRLLYLGFVSFLLPVLILFLLYFFIPGFHQNLDHYLSQQLIPAIQNQREVTTSSHFGLLISLFIQLIIPISILLISLIFKYLKPQKHYFENHKISLFYLLIGFSASLPLLITLKQRPFYLVPSIPFLILALSSFIFPFLKNILEKIPLKIHKWIQWGSFLIVIGVITFSVGNFGKIKRDQVMIHEMEKISQIVPDHETIYTDQSVWKNWTFTAYLSRYHDISLDPNHEQNYLLFPKKMILPETIIQKYKLINCNLMNYDLYKKKKPMKTEEILTILKDRFQKNANRHPNIDWNEVEKRIEGNSAKLNSLIQMEMTGGEPDVIGKETITDEIIYCDCSQETPKGRVSLCYDQQAWNKRKENKPSGSAMEMANSMGIEMLNEEQYLQLRKLGSFDLKTSSWIRTPEDIRKLGGALFGDCRFGRVFFYHNTAESYYSVRGFRGILKV